MKKLAICLAILSLASVAYAAPTVVISEVYGGGGNSGGVYNRDFVELFNMTASPIVIDGWSIQYGSATGSSIGGTTTSFQTNLTGTIQPCSWFLVGEAFGSTTTLTALPGPDASGAIAMSATTLKVFLVSITTPQGTACTGPNVVDAVAVGPTATCAEGTPTPVMANSTAAIRIVNASGYVDTNNNSADFTIGTPVAHYSGSGMLAECVGSVPAEQSSWGTLKQQYK